MNGADSEHAWYGVDPRSVAAGRVSALISTAITGFGAVMASLLLVVLSWPMPVKLMAALLLWGFVFISLLSAVILPEWRYRFTRWRLGPEGLEIRRGRWFRSEIALARSRVQHSDVSQGPIERSFGVATLTVYTAGTEHAAIALAGLSPETARALRAQLTGFGDGGSV
jgi:membrane protein YdbS with pleckstrin-like domain